MDFHALGHGIRTVDLGVERRDRDRLERCGNFSFTYLPTVMRGNIPHCTYELTAGITRDKQGMTIIENEHLLELIRSPAPND